MSDDMQPIRVIIRALAEFIFRAGRASAGLHDGDLLGAVVFATVKNANLSVVARHVSETGALFAALDRLTDDQLRPVSVNAISKSFSVPYETARGAAARLIHRGFCTRIPAGLIVPATVLLRQDVLDVEREISLILGGMLGQLGGIGFDFDQIAVAGGSADGIAPHSPSIRPPPTRQTAWIATDFLLGMVETLTPMLGDFTAGFIFAGVMAANTREVAGDAKQAWAYASMDAPLPDEVRRPIRVRHLAELLGLPFETTRRHVNRMVQAGLLVRMSDGVIVSGRALEQEQFLGAPPFVILRFTRMLTELKRVGYVFAPGGVELDAVRPPERAG